ncbi:MAG: hypothetical protein ABSG44_06555 [Thermodesulfobacteriota bacterium]|jgi:hypothetical protein
MEEVTGKELSSPIVSEYKEAFLYPVAGAWREEVDTTMVFNSKAIGDGISFSVD